MKETINGTTRFYGFCIDLLDELANTLNFTYVMLCLLLCLTPTQALGAVIPSLPNFFLKIFDSLIVTTSLSLSLSLLLLLSRSLSLSLSLSLSCILVKRNSSLQMTNSLWLKRCIFCDRVENIMGKGENAGQHFLLF